MSDSAWENGDTRDLGMMEEDLLFVKVGREVGWDVGSDEPGCDVGVKVVSSVGVFFTQLQSLVSKWEPIVHRQMTDSKYLDLGWDFTQPYLSCTL